MASACSVAMAGDSKMIGGLGGGGAALMKPSASSCVLVSVALVSGCVLVVCGVLVVREYALASDYRPTTCRQANVTYLPQDVTCTYCAGQRDKSKERGTGSCYVVALPCVRIIVTYVMKPSSHRMLEGLLHTDSLQATGQHSQVGTARRVIYYYCYYYYYLRSRINYAYYTYFFSKQKYVYYT